MTTKNSPNYTKKYCCDTCDFFTCKKMDYTRHLLTMKHKNNASTTDDNQKHAIKYACNFCEKSYNDRAGLWRHKKKCLDANSMNKEDPNDKDLIMMLIKQNTQLIEQNAELVKNGTHNTTNSHNNISNKTFNLQFFLNETCKDAMNIMDFVNSIQLQLTDLEKVGKIGYVEGISNIITANLKALDVTQRPIHCTDNKREVLYVKDENKWEKEAEEKEKIRRVIKMVTNKNIRMLSKFKDVHPDCEKSISKYSDEYNKIVLESFGGSGDNDLEKENKIIKNISKTVTIHKD